MSLTAAGPAGTAHNPFAGAAPDDGAELTFPAARYTTIGASDEELDDLRSYFDSLTRSEQRRAVAWHDEQSDEQLHATLERFRELRDGHAALAGADGQESSDGQAAPGTDELAGSGADVDEAADGAQQQAGHGVDASPTTFSAEQIAELKIDDVMRLVDEGLVTAGDALAAEQTRGDKARATLVKRLSELT